MAESQDPDRSHRQVGRTGQPRRDGDVAERVARVEEKLDHQTETLDRVEDAVTGRLSDAEDTIEANDDRVTKMWFAHRVAGGLVAALASGSGVAYLLGV